MATEQFVDVTYRGIELGKTLRLTEGGPTTAFIEFPTPMPVGAQIEIRTDANVAITAVVVRVTEQVAGAEAPPGMRVRVADLSGEAEAWWGSNASVGDPVIPTPPAGSEPEPEAEPEAEPDAKAEAEADAVPEQVLDGATDPVPAPEVEPEAEADAEPEPEAEAEPTAEEAVAAAASRRGGGRSTMMMSTDEIRAAIEAGGQEFDSEGREINAAAGDDEPGDGDGDGNDATTDDKTKGKKKKRRKKKRKK